MVTTMSQIGFGGSGFDYAIYVFMDVNDRISIRSICAGLPGIYCWFNTVNCRSYVGKGKDLYKRISDYYKPYYLNHNKRNSVIVRAILKHGINSFVLLILDINSVDLFVAEQKFIDLLKPAYNQILKVGVAETYKVNKAQNVPRVSSFLGKKHTPGAIELFRKYALARKNDPKPGFTFIITDTLTGTVTHFTSIRKGVKAMGWDQGYITGQLNIGRTKLYKKRYLMRVIKPTV